MARPDLYTPRAGEMRDRVSIQSPTWDSPRTKKTGWSDVYTNVAAFIDPMLGMEAFRAMRDTQEQWFSITIHYRTGITPDMRVLQGTTAYDIRAIRNVGSMNRLLMLTCRLVR